MLLGKQSGGELGDLCNDETWRESESHPSRPTRTMALCAGTVFAGKGTSRTRGPLWMQHRDCNTCALRLVYFRRRRHPATSSPMWKEAPSRGGGRSTAHGGRRRRIRPVATLLNDNQQGRHDTDTSGHHIRSPSVASSPPSSPHSSLCPARLLPCLPS